MNQAPEPSTTERILQAAIDEFVEFGYAGARMDRIAKRARCNKGMLYHHHGGKDELWSLALKSMLSESRSRDLLSLQHTVPLETVMGMLAHTKENADQGRLLLWEQLQAKEPIETEARTARIQEMLGSFEHIAQGDPELKGAAALAMVALASYPNLLPSFSKMIAGEDVQTPQFHAKYRRALQNLFKATSTTAPKPSDNADADIPEEG